MIDKQKPLPWYQTNVNMDTLMPGMNGRDVFHHLTQQADYLYG